MLHFADPKERTTVKFETRGACHRTRGRTRTRCCQRFGKNMLCDQARSRADVQCGADDGGRARDAERAPEASHLEHTANPRTLERGEPLTDI